MTRKWKVVIGVGVVVLLGTAAAISVASSGGDGVPVRMEEVGRRDIVSTVTASGNIRSARSVDISADISGRVLQLNVREGDEVEAGDVLLRIDPTGYASSVTRSEAMLSQSRSQLAQQAATVAQARRQLERVRSLWERDSLLVSRQEVEDAETSLEVALRQQEALEFGVSQSGASLQEAQEQLDKTVIRAPISGRITRLNVEEGETAIIGTMNNPGSLLLTIGELDAMEAVVQVDETDIPHISLGDSAMVQIDAFRDRSFPGTVTEIGNSAIQASMPTGSAASTSVDFEVVVTLREGPQGIRPDLSATAEIITATRTDVLTVPIIALTIRDLSTPSQDGDANGDADGEDDGDGDDAEGEEDDADGEGDADALGEAGEGTGDTAASAGGGTAGSSEADASGDREVEGVFVVRDGEARFTPVEIGITGREYFEVISGLSEGDTVVAGPYQRIRDLRDGQSVRPTESGSAEGSGS